MNKWWLVAGYVWLIFAVTYSVPVSSGGFLKLILALAAVVLTIMAIAVGKEKQKTRDPNLSLYFPEHDGDYIVVVSTPEGHQISQRSDYPDR